MTEKTKNTISLVMLGIIALPFVFFGLARLVEGKDVYRPLTPVAQKTYNSARQTFCLAEKTLASAKLLDHANNVLKLNPEDLAELARKRDQICLFMKAQQ
mgnify:CR=1 FL=1